MDWLTRLNAALDALGLSETTIDILAIVVPSFLLFVAWILRVPFWNLLRNAFRGRDSTNTNRLGIFVRDRDFVGAYNRKLKQYVAISQDATIAEALSKWSGVILLGRGGIGKSQTACEHIRRFCRTQLKQFPPKIWHVVSPNRQDLKPETDRSRFRKRQIIFFDDINEFFSSGDIGSFYAYLEHHRQTAKEVKMVCTCRSTTPEVESLEHVLKLFSRLREIKLPDWTDDQRVALASQTGVGEEEWDGTPLSAIMPSTEMRQRYLKLEEHDQLVLQSIKRLDEIGLNYSGLELLQSIFQTLLKGFDLSKSLKTLGGLGFFKRAGQEFEVYRPYLEFVDQPTKDIRETVHKSLIEPTFRFLITRVAGTLVTLGKLDEAKSLLKDDMAANGEQATSLYWLGVIARRSSKWEDAVEAFEKASTLDPGHPANWHQLISLYEKLGKAELANSARTQASLALSGQTPNGQLAIAMQAMSDGRDEAALEALEKALEGDDAIPQGYGFMGQVLLRLNRNEEAEAALKIAESRDPSAFVYFGIAQAQRNLKDWPNALESARKSIACDPDQPQAWSLRGQCEKRTGQLGDARDSYAEAIRLGAGAPAHFGLGLIYRDLKDARGMEEEFGKVVDLQRRNALAWSYLADAYVELGEEDKAINAFEKSISLQSNNRNLALAYANGLGHMGRVREAVGKLESICEEFPGFRNAKNQLEYWSSRI